MGQAIVVAIGRSIGDRSMPEGDWLRFQAEVRRVLHVAGAIVVFEGQGQGEYEGVPESSAAWIATPSRAFDVARLRAGLSNVVAAFGQEEIALVMGQTDPIRPPISP